MSSGREKTKRVLHLSCASLPWVTGGREIYTHSLSRELKFLGWESILAYHQDPSGREPIGRHEHEGITIQVMPPLPDLERSETYACRTEAVPTFQELLKQEKPDVVHFQDFSTGANLLHLDNAKTVGAGTVMTFHSPGQSCLQREMLYKGNTPCDGVIRLDRCTSCRLGVQGIPSWLSWTLSKITFPEIGDNKLSRALSARLMTVKFAEAFRELVRKIDRIHVLSHWVKEVLERNQVPSDKLAFFRSGLSLPTQSIQPRVARNGQEPLKLIMLGRCEKIKGQEVLIDAVLGLPAAMNVQVSFMGPYWDSTEYGKSCLKKIENDTRFLKPRLVPHHEIPKELSQADALVIPSTWFENAPLVVLEAQSYGLPVIGSRLGGIPEMVQDNINGLLFEVGSSIDLRRCIRMVLEKPDLLQRFRTNISKPRLMRDVAAETAQLYESVLSCVQKPVR